MCIKVPDAIKEFSDRYFSYLGVRKPDLLSRFLAAFVMGDGKRTIKSLGNTIWTEQRCKTTASKALRRSRFCTRDIHRRLIQALIVDYVRQFGKSGEWVLLIDGTATRRGSFTKIENGIKYRNKNKSSKGWSTKAHLFVMGILITPTGYRIPVTRYTYYTKTFCDTHKMTHITQNKLAAMMVDEIRSYLPAGVKLIVCADSFFDSGIMFKTCRENGAVYITPADSDRNFIHPCGYPGKLHERGKSKDMKDFRTFRIVKGREQWTGPHCRLARTDLEGNMKHIYRVMGEILNVSGLGDVRVVFSHKSKPGKKWTGSKSFMALICSDKTWDDGKIVEFYALRWQIEIYFRELKSDLGLGDFIGRDFRAFERFVDLCLMSFAFLEWHRINQMKTTRSRKEKGKLQAMRTRGLKSHLMEKEMEEAKQYVILKKPGGRGRKAA